MVPGDGFEPSASWTTTKRSNQLSYPGKGYRYRVDAHERTHVFGLRSIWEGCCGSQELYGYADPCGSIEDTARLWMIFQGGLQPFPPTSHLCG